MWDAPYDCQDSVICSGSVTDEEDDKDLELHRERAVEGNADDDESAKEMALEEKERLKLRRYLICLLTPHLTRGYMIFLPL